jgi:hypothetical protein
MKNFFYIVIVIIFSLFSCNYKNGESLHNIEKDSIKINIDGDSSLVRVDSIDFGKKWLLNFYENYIKFNMSVVDSNEPSKVSDFFKKLDSIKKVNCTQSFFEYQLEDFNKDFDYITNNEFVCEQSLRSLEVSKKDDQKDIYVVSFIAEYPINEEKSEYKKISFDVSIVKQNGVYRISKTCCF